DVLDILGPALIEFESGNSGYFRLVSIQGDIDYRIVDKADELVAEWSWEGTSDVDAACGRGWAVVRGEELVGHIYIHQSEDSSFAAVNERALGRSNRARRSGKHGK
ncbi:MAG TPA: hypothetical protein VFT12_04305, partial [Thermoanaerobaculia bacterium]|nr:hypothetical protein [Thermoanaerobaculia bacterium]